MKELGVTECLRVKEQALISASEAAEIKACSLTLRHSVTPSSFIFPIYPLYISKPASSFPWAISTFNY
jgi:hypothetical protein